VSASATQEVQAPNLVSGMTYYARRLQKLIPSRNGLKTKPVFMVETGDPAEVIVKVAEKRLADLIVLGARNAEKHLLSATHLPTSVAHNVIANADCPVLLLPS
jgi:nucleotide-binding universal stress UspA family protein